MRSRPTKINLSKTDSYTVKFDLKKPDGYWERREESFGGYSNKHSHTKAAEDCKKKYSTTEINILGVYYE